MALDAEEMRSQGGWLSHTEQRLAPGAALLLALGGSVFVWLLLIAMCVELLQLTG